VVRTGTATERMGTDGRYFATSFAVVPPRVRTMIRVAPTFFAVRTADEARLSKGLMGRGTVFIISLKIAE
jgi:hypothetical protein